MREFDEKDYWRRRHVDHNGHLKAVGVDTVPETANELAYRQLVGEYERVLDRLDLPNGLKALDAGAGVGAFTRVLCARGLDVTALDISQAALDAIDLPVTKVQAPIASATFVDRSFDYVHSFDVLYHIMDDDEWERSLSALAGWSDKYLVLHERFTRFPQWLPSKIMKMRPRQRTAQVLAGLGFHETLSTPTYVMTKHLATYRLSGLAPRPFHRFDDLVLERFRTSPLVAALASHRIKVFERV